MITFCGFQVNFDILVNISGLLINLNGFQVNHILSGFSVSIGNIHVNSHGRLQINIISVQANLIVDGLHININILNGIPIIM